LIDFSRISDIQSWLEGTEFKGMRARPQPTDDNSLAWMPGNLV